MPNPITTTGVSGGPISTYCGPGESTPKWVGRQSDLVQHAQPSGNKLTTTWSTAIGAKAVSTDRIPGESDLSFLLRHILEYTDAMVVDPPVP